MSLRGNLLCLHITASLLIGSVLSSCASTPAPEKLSSQETAGLHMQIAVSHIEKNNLPGALKELLTAEELDPRNPAIQGNLGLVYFLRGRYELSERHYLKSIAIQPNNTESKNNLARVYIETGNLKKAEPLLKEAMKDLTFPDYSSVYANFGILEFKRKNYNKAKVYLKKSSELDRENCLSRVYLGRSYLELNEISLASGELEKSIQLCQNAGVDDAHYYSAIAFYRNNQHDRSMVRLEEIVKLFPNGKNTEKAIKMLDIIRKGTL